jgi:hypothetical protein
VNGSPITEDGDCRAADIDERPGQRPSQLEQA